MPLLPWLKNLDSVREPWEKPFDVLEFTGPPTAHVFSYRYETLTTFGPKKEGEKFPGPLVWKVCEAWHTYKKTLLEYIGDDAQQIAWRELPFAQQNSRGDWQIYSRLYVWRGHT